MEKKAVSGQSDSVLCQLLSVEDRLSTTNNIKMKAVLCAAVALLLCSEVVSGAQGGRNDVEKWQSQCPPDVQVVSCVVDPCRFASCAVSGAKCRPNYCGGCFTDWKDGEGNLVSVCSTGPTGSD